MYGLYVTKRGLKYCLIPRENEYKSRIMNIDEALFCSVFSVKSVINIRIKIFLYSTIVMNTSRENKNTGN